MAVDWHGDEVMLLIEKATAEMIDKAAFLIEGETKINISNNGQVDTGFMVNSVYAVTPKADTYSAAKAAAEGRNKFADMAPKADPPKDGAVVGVGAEYAIFQEEKTAFLFPALEKVAAQMQGEIVAAGKKVIG